MIENIFKYGGGIIAILGFTLGAIHLYMSQFFVSKSEFKEHKTEIDEFRCGVITKEKLDDIVISRIDRLELNFEKAVNTLTNSVDELKKTLDDFMKNEILTLKGISIRENK